MKKGALLFLSAFLPGLFCLCANDDLSASASVSYYISPEGNDNNSGTSASYPWQTLDKVNSRRFSPGDKVLFERDGKWYGQLKIPASGITFGAYGSGEKPVIHGWKTLTGWTNEGGGLYSITDNNLLETARILTIDGEVRNKGRFPKVHWHPITKAEGNYYIYSELLNGSPNFTGAEIVCNKNDWVIDVGTITSHNGGSINYTGTSWYPQKNDHGFFIQNHINCLTGPGDWMFDGNAKKLTMYFGGENPDNYLVKVSSVDDVIVIDGKSDVVIENISIQGSNRTGIRLTGNPTLNILINSCDILFSGFNGVYLDPGAGWPEHITVNECLFEDTMLSGIDTRDSYHVTITNNIFKRTYLDPGSSVNGDASGCPVNLGGGYRNGHFTVTGNEIYDSGSHGINFRGSHILIEKNIISRFGLTHSDVGGIYSFGKYQSSTPGVVHIDRTVRNNIISNPDYVTPVLNSGNILEMGIYFDSKTSNVICTDNIIIETGTGFYTNSGFNLELKRNIIYKPRKHGAEFHSIWADTPISNIDFQDNKIYSPGEAILLLNNKYGLIDEFGRFDNNYYLKPDDGIYVKTHKGWTNYENFTLSQWKTRYGNDLNTKTSPTTSEVSDIYYNITDRVKKIDIGTNRIDINGNPVNENFISFEPFEGMIVLEGEPGL